MALQTHLWMNYFFVVERIVAKGQQDVDHKLCGS
jgi:hypothetical protein